MTRSPEPGYAQPVSQRERVRATAGSVVGTAVEYYDFFVYGAAAALVLNDLFFPSFAPLVGTMAAFATFAVGFFARPLGGLIFGHFGDRFGRKQALVITLLITGIGTFCIGLLPTYDQIGWLAPAALVFIRLLQGFAVGGEQGGAILMTAEYARPDQRGVYASLVQLGAPIGFLLPTAVFASLNAILTPEAFDEWGWRVPFLLSAILVFVGLYIRLKVSESPAFTQLHSAQKRAKRPLAEVLKAHPRTLLLGIGAKITEASIFTLGTTFILTYADRFDGRQTILDLLLVVVAVELMTIPLVGRLCDRVGRRTVFLAGLVIVFASALPLFWAVETGAALLILPVMLVMLPLGHACVYAPQASFLPELLPSRLRYSGISIIWQFGAMLGSGVYALVAPALLAGSGGLGWPVAVYTMALAVLSFACMYKLPETAPRLRGGDINDWAETYTGEER